MGVDPPRPLGAGQAFARGWRLWSRNLRELLPASLAVLIPLQALNGLVIFLTFPGYIKVIEAYPRLIESIEAAARNPDAPPPMVTDLPQPGDPEYALMSLGQVV